MSIQTIEAELKKLAEIAGTDIEHLYDEVLGLIYRRKVEVRNEQKWKLSNTTSVNAANTIADANIQGSQGSAGAPAAT